jgi:cytochrome c peroxidase
MACAVVASGITFLTPFAARVAGQPAPPGPEPISPIAKAEVTDVAKLALGERLFHDRRLSRGNVVACDSCHILDQTGDDRVERSIGLDGRPLDFNTPTIFNAALNFRLNWRGNFRAIEEQNEAVLLDPRIMGTSWDELLAKLRTDPDYETQFAAVYGTLPERASVLDALAVFQRSLVTPNARFDRYLRGEPDAITADEERGYRLFKAHGCAACHQGRNVGGNLFQKFGIFSDPLAAGSDVTDADLGRFTITRRDADRQVFRVPSLRNVAVSAPYFHDGRTPSLAKAVEIMARTQLDRELAKQDIDFIVAFLGTLTGEYRGRPLQSAAARPP